MAEQVGEEQDKLLVDLTELRARDLTQAVVFLDIMAVMAVQILVGAEVLVQEMVTGGQEMLLGITPDATFGPVLAVGFGGIHVEVLKDIAFRLPAIGPADAEAMLRELRLFPLLEGVRGAPASDLPALVDAICRFGWLAADLGDAPFEVEVNPLIVLPTGRGVRVVDALVVRR